MKTDDNYLYINDITDNNELKKWILKANTLGINNYRFSFEKVVKETKDENGKIIYKWEDGSILTKYSGKNKKITLPPVSVIGSESFKGNEYIEEIIVPSTVIKINNRAFESCKNLKKITFTGNTEIIGEDAFAYCINLEHVELCKSIKVINYGAFLDCNKLSKINLYEGLDYIGAYSFRNTSIEEIIIPSTITFLGFECFMCTHKLKKFKCLCSNTDIFGSHIDASYLISHANLRYIEVKKEFKDTLLKLIRGNKVDMKYVTIKEI